MNQAHLHLLLNHLPILGVLFGLLVLISGLLLNNQAVKQTALGLFVLAAICAIPAYLTGEGAEELVENLPGVTETLIERHEERANFFLGIVGGLGILSLITWYAGAKQHKAAAVLYAFTLVVALSSMALAQQVGVSGGEIRHTEIRSTAAAAANGPQQNGSFDQPQEEDED